MSTSPLYLAACTIINNEGIHTIRGSTPWNHDQNGPAAITRPQVLGSPYRAFGKLNLPDKLAFSAASLTLQECSVANPDTIGIFLGIPYGSTSTDYLYRQTVEEGAPSPALFSATLPSSPVTDIAIYYRLKGPNMVFCGGTSPLLSAIESAQDSLIKRKASGTLVILVEETTGEKNITTLPPFASALYLSSEHPPTPPVPRCSYIHTEKETVVPEPPYSDRTLMVSLFEKLRGKESGQLAVPVSGFRGYISLQYPGKDT